MHAFITDDGLQIVCGSTACAQHMYQEPGDNCYKEGYGWYQAFDSFSCDEDTTKNYHCIYCYAGFDTVNECSAHESSCPSNHNSGYYCSFCKMKFQSDSEAKSHEKQCSTNPTSGYMYNCVCGQGFKTFEELSEHKKTCNGSNQPLYPYRCRKCNISFSNQWEYNNHKCKYD